MSIAQIVSVYGVQLGFYTAGVKTRKRVGAPRGGPMVVMIGVEERFGMLWMLEKCAIVLEASRSIVHVIMADHAVGPAWMCCIHCK